MRTRYSRETWREVLRKGIYRHVLDYYGSVLGSFVHKVTTFPVTKEGGIYWLAEWLLSSQKGLCPLKSVMTLCLCLVKIIFIPIFQSHQYIVHRSRFHRDLYECRYLHEWYETEFLDFAASDESTGPDPDERSVRSAGGIITGKKTRSSQRKTSSNATYLLQISHRIFCDWTSASTIRSLTLTTWAVTLPVGM